MRFVVVLCLILNWTSAQASETIKVLGGEHEGFTRLVLHASKIGTWETEFDERMLRISFPESSLIFDLSKSFERIGQSRISNVSKTTKGIELVLNCDCGYDVREYGQKMLIIDIGERLLVDSPANVKPNQAILPVVFEEKRQDLNHDILTEKDIQRHAARLSDVEDRLHKKIRNAADIGLVNLVSLLDEKEGPNNYEGDDFSNITVRKGSELWSDFKNENGVEFDEVTQDNENCISNDDLDIAEWAVGNSFGDGLSQIFSSIADEDSEVGDPNSIRLIRHYLYYGLVEEAQANLILLGESEDLSLLRAIAYALEPIGEKPKLRLESYSKCKGDIAIWSLASLGDNRIEPDVDIEGQISSFLSLPFEIQKILGARIADTLRKNAMPVYADQVLAIVRNQHYPHPNVADLRISKYEKNEKQTPVNSSQLVNIVSIDTKISPDALSVLIEGELEAGRDISQETLELLLGFVHQYRNEEFGSLLSQLLYKVRLHKKQFSEAWAMAAPEEVFLVEPGWMSLFFDHLAGDGTDFQLVRYTSNFLEKDIPLDNQVYLSIADRLLASGFLDLSHAYAMKVSNAFARERRLLLARIAIAKGEFFAAKAELLGLQGEEAEDLARSIPEARTLVESQEQTDIWLPSGSVSIHAGHLALQKSSDTRSKLMRILSEARGRFPSQ